MYRFRSGPFADILAVLTAMGFRSDGEAVVSLFAAARLRGGGVLLSIDASERQRRQRGGGALLAPKRASVL